MKPGSRSGRLLLVCDRLAVPPDPRGAGIAQPIKHPAPSPGTFVSLAHGWPHGTVDVVRDMARQVERRSGPYPLRDQLFYRVFLPLAVFVNLALGVVILLRLSPAGWTQWLEVGTGVFCCVVAGWLAAAAWSKFYWNNAMARQVAVWRRIADAFFGWLEEAPVPADALTRLKTSLDEVVPKTTPS